MFSREKLAQLSGKVYTDFTAIELPRPPKDYHTICVDSGQEDDYKYDYYIFDRHRAKPYMVIKFTLIINDNKNLNIIECEKCDENVLATVYCLNDECYLCTECDNIVHSDTNDKFRENILQKHRRIPADDKEKSYGK